MTTLHDRLAALADEAPETLAVPGLWERGRRHARRRRQRAVLAVATVVLAAGALGTAAWPRATQPAVPAGAGAALPDRLFTPSPWLGTTTDGAPGRVVALFFAGHGTWTGTEWMPVVVSATSGDYAFLELPGRASADDLLSETESVALSPDGTEVAYLLGGRRGGTSTNVVTGVGVYDTVTGEVRRHRIDTRSGLVPYGLAWSRLDGEPLLWLPYAQLDAPARGGTWSSSYEAAVVWNLATDVRTTVREPRPLDLLTAGTGPDGFVVRRGAGLRLVRGPDDLRRPAVRRPPGLGQPSFVDPSETRVAGQDARPAPVEAGTARRVFTAPFSRDGQAPPSATAVPGLRSHRVLGWRDPEHVVALDAGRAGAVRSVDVTTGRGEDLTVLPDGQPGTQLAGDLLDAPTYDAVEPPRPTDPRLVTGLLVALASAVALLWRRRVRD